MLVLGALIALAGAGLLGVVDHGGAESSEAADSLTRDGSAVTVNTSTVPGDELGEGRDSRPQLDAEGVILLDQRDGSIVFARNPDKPLPMASTTKIMTAVLALDDLALDETVSVSARAASMGGSELWLEGGEVLSVQDLLYGLLVKSANDAAVALAETVAGDVEGFVDLMNRKAEELGLENTHFTNPHGLDMGRYDSDQHYSSARDLAELSRHAMQDAEFRRLVSTVEVTIPWPGREYSRLLNNRNSLMGEVPFITGVKTGYTQKAGYCLVGAGARDGAALISVLLGGASKEEVNSDSLELLDWGFSHYSELELLEEGEAVVETPVPYSFGEKMSLVADRRLVRTLRKGEEITREVLVVEEPDLPVEVGDVLGKATFKVGGEPLAEVSLVAQRAVKEPTLRDKLQFWWDRLLYWTGAHGAEGETPAAGKRPVPDLGGRSIT